MVRMKKCKICEKDISNRMKGTIYCTKVCKNKASKKKIIKFYGDRGKLRYDIILRRDELITLKGGRCYFCNNSNKTHLQIHHLTYKNNELNNVELLCRSCHTKLHNLMKQGINEKNI